MKKSEDPIIVEQVFNTSIENVWKAITDLPQMKQWFFANIESFIPVPGFETQFEINVEDKIFTQLWKITEVMPNKKIKYNWKYKEYPGDSFVTFELSEINDSVKLRLISEVVEDFPDDIPEFKRESGVQGWNYFIKNRLKEFINRI